MTVSVVVPYRNDGGHRHHLWNWVAAWWDAHFPDWELVHGHTDHEPFNRGASRNLCARQATGDILIIADADTVPDCDAVVTGVELVESKLAPWVIPYDGEPNGRYYNLTEEATRRRLHYPPEPAVKIAEPWDHDDWEHKLVSWAGCLIVPRASFWHAGGYPEFSYWSYEDNCFKAALDVMVGPHHRVPGFCVHLWHPATEKERFGNPGVAAQRKIYQQYARAKTPAQMQRVIDEFGTRPDP